MVTIHYVVKNCGLGGKQEHKQDSGVLGMGQIGLRGGVIQAPQRRGGGGGRKGALVTRQSQEASLKPLMMTHQLRREVAWKIFFQKKFSPMIHTSK